MVEERMRTALHSKLPDPPDGFGERNDQLILSLMSGRKNNMHLEKSIVFWHRRL